VADADSPVPLCTAAQFESGAFADLATYYTKTTGEPLADILSEATRTCEGIAGHRLVPFTSVPETHRAEGMDPDEYTDAANLPLDITSAVGQSYAQAMGVTTLVRHCWLNEYAVRYPELWTYGSLQIEIIRSYGGSQNLTAAQYIGAENDSGHIWFQLGQFIPIGSLIRVYVSGGYTVAIPSDLVRAGKFMTAWMIVTELNPEDSGHDPDRLYAAACKILAGYGGEDEQTRKGG
jgi:hypothetical protein